MPVFAESEKKKRPMSEFQRGMQELQGLTQNPNSKVSWDSSTKEQLVRNALNLSKRNGLPIEQNVRNLFFKKQKEEGNNKLRVKPVKIAQAQEASARGHRIPKRRKRVDSFII